METTIKPVQNGRGRKRRWPAEQKLAVLQEWKTGVPLEEVCRKYAVNAAQMYRWKRSLDQGLKESGELAPIREHGDRVLRVIYNDNVSPKMIVSVYFDRSQRGKL